MKDNLNLILTENSKLTFNHVIMGLLKKKYLNENKKYT